MFTNQQDSLPTHKLLVFIDSSIKNYHRLVDGIVPEAEAIVLDSREDGVEQITAILKAKQHVDTVHIISHGSPGCLYLGNSELSLSTLNLYSWDLHSWSIDNLLLYGCNLAAGDAGEEFIRKLHHLTDAEIAASAKRTGNRNKGGDWNLEVTTKPMEISLAFRQEVVEAYDGVFAEFVVDILNDENDGVNIGGVSLRDAINAANVTNGADVITFASNLSGTISLTEGELLIADDLTINGLGADILSVSGNSLSRVFNVNDSNNNNQIAVLIDRLTITEGQISGDDGDGGGILNVENLTITNSTITDNNADDDGGGIRNDGILTIAHSTVSNNTSIGTSETSGGGGIINTTNGSLEIYNSTLSSNEAINGGGIRNDGTLNINNTTLSGNSAQLGGGAVINTIDRNNNAGIATITNTTIANNTAGVTGGGIANPGEATITNTIIATNTATEGTDVSESFDVPVEFLGQTIYVTFTGTFTSGGYNLIGNGDGASGFEEITDIVGTSNALVDPLLADLADNGGCTASHALLAGSVAIDAGSTTEATDQRGISRDRNPDIGAFESPDGTGNNFDGTTNDDTIVGTADYDTIKSYEGNDTITGGTGIDRIFTGDGADVIVFNDVNEGYDRILDFEVGRDLLDITAIVDSFNYYSNDLIGDGFIRLKTVNQNNGNVDTRIDIDIDGSLQDYSFQKLAIVRNVNPENINLEDLFGTFGDRSTVNEIRGTQQQDRLIGLSGNDHFMGLGSDDFITTGAGQDVVEISSLDDGYDRIVDFDVNNDQIDLSAVLDLVNYSGADVFGDGVLRWTSLDVSTGTNSRLDLKVGNGWQGIALLRDVELNNLSESSFLITE